MGERRSFNLAPTRSFGPELITQPRVAPSSPSPPPPAGDDVSWRSGAAPSSTSGCWPPASLPRALASQWRPSGLRPPAVPGSIRSGKGAELEGGSPGSRRALSLSGELPRLGGAPHCTPRVAGVGTQGLSWTPSSSPPSRETCH